jgi:hypothetical protein
MTLSKLQKNRGSISAFLIFLLAIVGVWYGYRSYKAGNLSNDLSSMLADCRRITGNIAMVDHDRVKLDQAYATISQMAAKYKITAPVPTTTP